MRSVQTWLDRGDPEVVDADLSGYFDSIPHPELMECVARRISDSRVLPLVKVWLEAAVEETDEQGRRQRTTRNKDEGRGTPQGGVLSPLLANLSMRRFVLGWRVLGRERRLDAHIVNYADDFVICCRPGVAGQAMAAMRQMMGKLRLTVNERKTRQCSVRDETFAFLGFTFGRRVSWKSGRAYVAPAPAKSKVQAICRRITGATSRSTTWRDTDEQVIYLNRILRGWANYFRLGFVAGAWAVVQQHTCRRLRWWLRRKRGRSARTEGPPDLRLYEDYGLVKLTGAVRRLPLWA